MPVCLEMLEDKDIARSFLDSCSLIILLIETIFMESCGMREFNFPAIPEEKPNSKQPLKNNTRAKFVSGQK